jgi:hypothetical protein
VRKVVRVASSLDQHRYSAHDPDKSKEVVIAQTLTSEDYRRSCFRYARWTPALSKSCSSTARPQICVRVASSLDQHRYSAHDPDKSKEVVIAQAIRAVCRDKEKLLLVKTTDAAAFATLAGHLLCQKAARQPHACGYCNSDLQSRFGLGRQ